MKGLYRFCLFFLSVFLVNGAFAQCDCSDGTVTISNSSKDVGTLNVSSGEKKCIEIQGDGIFRPTGTINTLGGELCIYNETGGAAETVNLLSLFANNGPLTIVNNYTSTYVNSNTTVSGVDLQNYGTISIGNLRVFTINGISDEANFYNHSTGIVTGTNGSGSGELILKEVSSATNDGLITLTGDLTTQNNTYLTNTGTIQAADMLVGNGGDISSGNSVFLNDGGLVEVTNFTKQEAQIYNNDGIIRADDLISFTQTGVVYSNGYSKFETENLTLSGGGGDSGIEAPITACSVFWVHDKVDIASDYKGKSSNVWILDDTPFDGDEFAGVNKGPLFINSGADWERLTEDQMYLDYHDAPTSPVQTVNGDGSVKMKFSISSHSSFGWGTYEYGVANNIGIYASVSDTGRGDAFATCAKEQFEILPVEFMSFTGFRNEIGAVRLNWLTASERQNNYFEIERSTDGFTFEKIGEVAGAGTTSSVSSYVEMDASAPFAVVYYRLNQVDFDGRSSFSKTISVEAVETEANMVVYPNPLLGEELSLKWVNVEGEVEYTLFNAQGVEILQGEVSSDEVKINLSQLEAGVYVIQSKTSSGVFTEKLIVE